ncbi:MAG TPA: septal ring lytic transglycosylase RlpA family protein [Allosphingosinicella sp.]|nr:septal ring lytic transglycosylase RlpA family protein [Allosphingosinicella sp.]
MIAFKIGRSGHAVTAVALAGLLTSVPVRADTPSASVTASVAIAEAAAPDARAPVLPVVTTPAMRAQAEAKLKAIGDLYEAVGEGEASYYGHELAGNRTASGERFNPHGLTAAHRTLPLGSTLRVTNQANGKSVVVRVNDRGPFAGHRILDLSLGAAKRIDMFRAGKARVRLELLR